LENFQQCVEIIITPPEPPPSLKKLVIRSKTVTKLQPEIGYSFNNNYFREYMR